ncbi:MAG TPA: hypothetical protein PKC21_02475 [Oligoflexia bacterium]|nr:hypothetical protein [Oligoflexia bacterium]HMR24196.1 hypothetical protein [Oligoflexia bacterium]
MDKGIVSSSDVCAAFNTCDWKGELNKVISTKDQSKIYYSPSIEFENIDTLNCISISCEESEIADGYFFYVFHYYPKPKLSFFDKLSKKRPILEKEKLDQSHDQVVEIFECIY